MANNTLIGALRTEATLESGKFVDGAKKIRTEAKKTETQLKSSFSAMGAAVKGFGGAMTAGLSVGLLAGLGKKLLDNVAALKTTAAQLGVTTRELQLFSYAAGQVGIKQADADKALERMNVSMGKAAAGSKTAIKAFGAVGVSIDDIKTKSKTEIFAQIADQMIKQGGAAKNAAAANAIFGESASKLTPLLDQGSKGINELSAAADRLGIVLSDQQIQNADETAQKLDDVKRVLGAQISGVVADNANSILGLAKALGDLTSAVINFLGSNPQAALGIIGALAGSRFGIGGAVGGGIAGLFAGGKIAANARDANPDIKFRKAQLAKARELYGKYQKAGVQNPAEASGLNREIKLANSVAAATMARLAKPKAGAAPSIPQFLASAPKGGGGGSKRTPRAPRDRSDDVAYQFDQELRRAQMDTLRAQQSLATNSADRAMLAIELLDLQRADQEAELNNRVRRAERDFAEGKITAGALEEVKVQAGKLRAQYDAKDALERQAVADDLAAEKARDAVELRQSDFDLRIEALQLEASLKETAAERRAVELRILELMKEQEKARLDAVLADQDASDLAKAQAQQRKDQLDSIYAGRAANVVQGTRGPMEQLGAEFGDIGEELEQLKVNGIMGAVDALGKLTEGWDSFRDAALSAIKQVIAELIRLQLMKMAANLIGGFGGGGGGLPDFGASAFSFGMGSGSIPGIPAIPGFAGGGSIMVGGNRGVDKNLLSLNGMPVARVNYGERIDVSNDNRAGSPVPPFVFNNYARMSAREARETGMQAAAGWSAQMAKARNRGYD